MVHQLQTRKRRAGTAEGGFTIIEVLIVLAIAGLILMIVFLAVPALQRNSRNTQRKNDVQALLGSISEYEGNNNGSLPASGSISVSGSTATIGASGTAQATANLGYYNSGTVKLITTPPASAPTDATDEVDLVLGYSCSDQAPTKASARNLAAVYWIESASGNTEQCASS